jgi:tetratricopeptide (TPR) repeat protein
MRLADPAAAARAYGLAGDPEARGQRGLALLSLGRATEALPDLDAALAAGPGDADLMLGRGLALAALGRRDEAVAALRAFLTAAPTHIGAIRARAELRRLSP